MDHFRVGVIGYGVTRLYTAALMSVPYYYAGLLPIELTAIATHSVASGEAAKKQFGFQRATTDYRELLAADDINTIILATPNHLHAPMLRDWLQSDKALMMDKPLATSLADAEEILSAARARGKDAQMIFEFRFCPAVQVAQQMICSGRIGKIFALRAHYFRSSYCDPAKPLRWKGSAAQAGSGALSDLSAHVIDMITWMVGAPVQANAQLRTFIHERPSGAKDGSQAVIDTDDHAVIQLAFPQGAVGVIEAGRMINGAVNDLGFEINGSEGSLRWNMMDPNHLYFADGRAPAEERGWLQIPTGQRYPDAVLPGADIPVGMMRFHVASIAAFLRSTQDGKPYDPDLRQGVQVQAVLEAALESNRRGAWAEVKQIAKEGRSVI